MLRIKAHQSAQAAKQYYRRSDYYLEGQETVGRWEDQGAGKRR